MIALKGEHAGDWHDFDGNHGGGPLSTLEEGTGRTGRDLLAHAADLAGWSPGAPIRQAPPAIAKPERDTAREIAFILDHARPIAGTPAEAYLRGRGLDVPDHADLLAHLDLTHWETKSGYPALIGVVRDRPGNVVAIHRTYLQSDAAQPDKVAKAPVTKPRMMLGKTGGGAVRLAPLGQSGVLALSEGIETGACRYGRLPGACRLGDLVDLRPRAGAAAARKPGGSSFSPIMTHPAPGCAPPRPPHGGCGPRPARSRSRCRPRPATTSTMSCCAADPRRCAP